ncbi:MAG TPA: hypothetical protein EYP10_09720, partial [Armatimonadetes bacterium]|nr:hypothetical protein [Armatimonadota bacterium]
MNWEALAETLKLSDEQRSAVEADGKNVLVIAGAGTGKTYTLLARYLKALLCDGLDINQIVAITFTEKAAAEMRQRLRQCLHQLMKFESARERIVQALESLPEAPIGTIHHFCAQLLRRYAYAVGVDPSFSIIDELQAQGLRNRIVTEWLLMQLADALAQCNADVTTLIAEFGFNRVAEILRATLEARLVIEW